MENTKPFVLYEGDNFMRIFGQYFRKGRTLKWGEDLTVEQMKALKDRELFTLLDQQGNPYSEVLMDSYGQIRERRIKQSQ